MCRICIIIRIFGVDVGIITISFEICFFHRSSMCRILFSDFVCIYELIHGSCSFLKRLQWECLKSNVSLHQMFVQFLYRVCLHFFVIVFALQLMFVLFVILKCNRFLICTVGSRILPIMLLVAGLVDRWFNHIA